MPLGTPITKCECQLRNRERVGSDIPILVLRCATSLKMKYKVIGKTQLPMKRTDQTRAMPRLCSQRFRGILDSTLSVLTAMIQIVGGRCLSQEAVLQMQ
jgi:hypothetical protein